jgi:NAD/NADP transhydrogenase beta subunit
MKKLIAILALGLFATAGAFADEMKKEEKKADAKPAAEMKKEEKKADAKPAAEMKKADAAKPVAEMKKEEKKDDSAKK